MKKTLKSQILDFIETDCNKVASWSKIHAFILKTTGFENTKENRGQHSGYLCHARNCPLTTPTKKDPRFLIKNPITKLWEMHYSEQ
ncbi:MAG: hypothetical protein WC979_02325 [Candidatus Pacearchaeota archaeon]|jgi:hypothetical protein|nr:hypothetical protein [Clostridia bacterium]